jgi:choline dehydrogenase-like flavoprotein
MATSPTPQTTDFTRDVLGRYVCNGLDEALQSIDGSVGTTRPFDVIVIGGGSFGSVFAQHLFANNKTHRILVLEGGPLLVPEHVQNLPMLGLNQPQNPATSDPGVRNEVWGLPWNSNVPGGFYGLAYCLGGRSLYWGGWSPQLLNPDEMPPAQWPATAIAELNNPLPNGSAGYFRQASEQIAVTETNDFIFGDLHTALRKRLFDGINANKVTDAIPLAQLPLHLDNIPAAQRNLFKLEAPLAVEGRPPRSGYFPLNKFSALPLLIKAARAAQGEAGNVDSEKRLMVVPQCHVKRLVTVPLSGGMQRVIEVDTNRGPVPVPPGAVVVLALGTIESARLALVSFQGLPNYGQIGKNLMAHLRSNMVVSVQRADLPAGLPTELQASALFVKGKHKFGDGTHGYFHLQITAAGLGPLGTNGEVELFQKVPDIDTLGAFQTANDTKVVIHIRGIGEMQSDNPGSHVSRDLNSQQDDIFGIRRAFVSIADPDNAQVRAANPRSAKDFELWNAMDTAANDVATVLSGGNFQVLSKFHDGLGTTHHEAGTLRMGANPNSSVTNADARFHEVPNAYVAGPALFPTIGSPNPMLTGTALARRLADNLVLHSIPSDVFIPLFDGSTTNWRMSTIQNQPPATSNPGNFVVVNGTLEAVPGNDIGLYWCTTPTPPDFILKLEWFRFQQDDNSGVFIRFPDPTTKGYNNTAYVGVDFGFEVQIDENGAPDGADIHKTGAIYGQAGQNLNIQPARAVGQWNEFDIRVQGQSYTVLLNGVQVAQFNNTNANRGLATTAAAASYIGFQAYPGKRIAFRNIQIKAL